jgi:hypothetical protein
MAKAAKAANATGVNVPSKPMRMLSSKFSTKNYAPGDYAAYRAGSGAKKPPNVFSGLVSDRTRLVKPAVAAKKPAVAAKKPAVKPASFTRNVTSEKLSPVKTMPTRMAVNPFTGNTTGFTTGKTTGSRVSKPGVAGKTPQSAYSRQMANAVERGGFSASKSGGAGKTPQSSTSRSRSMGGASSSSRGGGYMR